MKCNIFIFLTYYIVNKEDKNIIMKVARKYNSMLRQTVVLFSFLLASTVSGLAQTDCSTVPLNIIKTHPRDSTICNDGQSSHDFSVVTDNDDYNYRYQWLIEDTGTGNWNPLNNADNSVFNASSAGNYRCLVYVMNVSNQEVCRQYSDAAKLTVGFIAMHPQPPAEGSICAQGSNAPNVITSHSFVVDMYPPRESGDFLYIFAWKRQSETTGDWGSTLSNLHSYPASTAGNYRCEVIISSPRGIQLCTQISNTATLVVDRRPDVPEVTSVSVCIGETFTAKVNPASIVTNGRDLTTYEWRLYGIGNDADDVETDAVINNSIPNLERQNAQLSQANRNYTLTIANTCGWVTTERKAVVVWDHPKPPTPDNSTYCQDATPVVMSIDEKNNEAVWFKFGTDEKIDPPLPDTSQPGMTEWHVMQYIKYPDENVVEDSNGEIISFDPGPVCPSPRATAFVNVIKLSKPPVFKNDWDLCLNTVDVTIEADGTGLRWYNSAMEQQSVASLIQINTTVSGRQTYYVTQVEVEVEIDPVTGIETSTNLCESLKEQGEISIFIRDMSNIENMDLVYEQELCPLKSTRINVVSNIANATFRWYSTPNKIIEPEDPDADPPPPIESSFLQYGMFLDTPQLEGNAFYYVSIEYDEGGERLCESINTKAAAIFVRDITPPEFPLTEEQGKPRNIFVDTDPGVCYATINLDSQMAITKASVWDNCTDVEDLLVFIDPPAPDDYRFEMGDATLIWWVQDQAENLDYTMQSIQVRDRERPQGTCPAEIVWEVDENATSARVTYSLDFTDNCGEVFYELNRGMPSGSVFPLGSTFVRYLVSDAQVEIDGVPTASGNIDTCAFNVIVRRPIRPLIVDLRPSVRKNEVCPNEQVIITPNVSGGTGNFTYMWKPNGRTTPVMEDYPRVNTTYEVTISDGESTVTESVHIRVLQRQPVSLILEGRSMNEIFEGDEVLVTATPGFESYKLILEDRVVQMSGTNNAVSFLAEIGYYDIQVFATDDNGCVAQDFMRVEIDSRTLPNVFTPNFDGINDVFLEGFLRDGDSLEVFNRAGLLLYSGHEGWDGFYRGRLMPQGTYLYVVKRRMNNDELRIFTGEVTLIIR